MFARSSPHQGARLLVRWRSSCLRWVVLVVLCMSSTSVQAQSADGAARAEEEESGPSLQESVVITTTPEEESLFETDAAQDEEEDAAQQGEAQQNREEAEALDQRATREQLSQAGFRFGDYSGARRRSTAFLWALLPGMLLHGAGHLYLEEQETAIALILMEVGGLGMIGLGALLPLVTRGRIANSATARPLFYTGMGLLISSYMIDVVGVIRGDSPLIYESPLRRAGVSLELDYQFMLARFYPMRNILQAEMALETGRFQVSANTLQDVSLLTSRYGGMLGWRIWQLTGTENQVFVEGSANLLQFRDIGRFQRAEAMARVGGVLDLGVISPHLRKVYFGMRGGYAYQLYAFPEALLPEVDVQNDAPPPLEWSSSGVGLIPLEVFGGMSFSEKFHVQLSYARHDGEFLHDVHRLLGVPAIHMDYRSARNFDLTFDAQYGAGFVMGAGLRIWLYTPLRGAR